MANPAPIPLTVSSTAGASPTDPQTLRDTLVQNVAAVNPGYTANLPGTLIEDIASTDVGVLATIDQARVDAVNSFSPYQASPWVLAQLGAQFGITRNQATNTSVYVVFSGPAGYVIPAGFTVTDGTHNYALTNGGAIGSDGNSLPLQAVATNSGTWVVPANTVNQLVSSVPSGYTLTVTNPNAGTPGVAEESVESYRARVIEAGQASSQGAPALIKSMLSSIPGVQPRLVSVRQVAGTYQIICGGSGDPMQIADVIVRSTLHFPMFIGSRSDPSLNVKVSLIDYPDTYTVVYVNPAQMHTQINLSWNVSVTNLSVGPEFNSIAQTTILNAVNSIPVGQDLNLFALEEAVYDAMGGLFPIQYLSSLVWTVTINGSVVQPQTGTSLIASPGTSYFYSALSDITVSQA